MQVHQCLQRALDHIEAHLREHFELEDLADEANYSIWHFHRLFSAWVGYTVGDYVRRRRMSEASRELVFHSDPIKEIARRYQFESQEAFTRAFKSFSGFTPGQLRREQGPLVRFSPINLTQSIKHFRKGVLMLKPQIRRKAAFTVMGLAGQFTMENNTIHLLWDDFNRRDKEIPNAIHDAAIGVCYHDDNYSPEKSFTYMAGFAVSKVEEIPAGMSVRDLPEGEYAVFEHKGALDSLSATYDMIYREWLPSSEYELDPRDDFELYDERFDYGKPESILEIWIPIKKKAE